MVLNAAGVTVTEVADRAGIAQPSVSAQLAGKRRLLDKTLQAIHSLAGPDVADEVRTIAGEARARYLLELQAGRM
jgi:transcriptional regulator with XRE-family HTH domain